MGAGLYGLGTAPLWPTVIAGIAAKTPAVKLGEVLSTVFIDWLIGAGLGPVIVNFIINHSYSEAFLVLGLFLLFAFALTLAGEFSEAGNHVCQTLPGYFQDLWGKLVELRLLLSGAKYLIFFGQQSPFYVSSAVLITMALFYAFGNINKLMQPT